MPNEQRTERFMLRCTPSELAMLRELADESGLSASDEIRQFIRREHAERFGKSKAKKPKR